MCCVCCVGCVDRDASGDSFLLLGFFLFFCVCVWMCRCDDGFSHHAACVCLSPHPACVCRSVSQNDTRASCFQPPPARATSQRASSAMDTQGYTPLLVCVCVRAACVTHVSVVACGASDVCVCVCGWVLLCFVCVLCVFCVCFVCVCVLLLLLCCFVCVVALCCVVLSVLFFSAQPRCPLRCEAQAGLAEEETQVTAQPAPHQQPQQAAVEYRGHATDPAPLRPPCGA